MIEAGIIEALHEVVIGSKQETWAKAMKALLEAGKADGFVDPGWPDEFTAQTDSGIKTFSDETKAALNAAGYRAIYPLTGKSLRDLKEAGRPFSSDWFVNEKFGVLPSRLSEVAIKPDRLFLPNSNNKTLEHQEALVRKFSEELRGRIPGVEAILGEAPDYAELALAHFGQTGERLFGERDNYGYTRTKTGTGGSAVADVGCFDARDGLDVYDWHAGYGDGFLWAAPLVVPA